MNVGEVGSLYLKDRPAAALASKHPASAFADLFAAAAGEESGRAPLVRDVGKPLGAAANSAAKDASHAARKTQTIDRTDKLYDQCRELETFLIKNLLSGLRKTVEKSEMSDGGFAGNMYEDMLWDKYAESMSRNAGLGLADQVYLELSGRRGKTL
jgi:flagellar protein FlgJ